MCSNHKLTKTGDYTGTDKTRRLDEINRVIYEVFPEPNRLLLQRYLPFLFFQFCLQSKPYTERVDANGITSHLKDVTVIQLVLGYCILHNHSSIIPPNEHQTHQFCFRILKMMQVVESHKAVNRMSQSALAACMAPLLLRPLLLGECEIDNDFSMGGDGSFQLLQAAAAANHAQAIVIVMLEEYDQIFDVPSFSMLLFLHLSSI
jgi:hypothetical protein